MLDPDDPFDDHDDAAHRDDGDPDTADPDGLYHGIPRPTGPDADGMVRWRLYDRQDLERHVGDADWLHDPTNYRWSEPRPERRLERLNVWAESVDWERNLERILEEADSRSAVAERGRRLRRLGERRAPRRTYPLEIGAQRGTSPPLSVRLPTWLEEQVRREIDALGVTPSVALRQIVEEWWVSRRYPALEFRAEAFVRLAAIRGGPTVREWIEAEPRPSLADDIREQVLDYYELFRARFAIRPRPQVPPR